MRRASFLAMGAFLTGLGIGYFAAMATRPRLDMRTARPADTRADLAAIEKLHKEDIEATLTQDPSLLIDLWSEDGVNLGVPGSAVVGKKAIQDVYEKFRAKHPGFQVLSYTPGIKDLQLVDGWAFEWGYIEATYKMSPEDKPVNLRSKGLRVLKRESDGSWKFARVGGTN